jgi:hypothetical protein
LTGTTTISLSSSNPPTEGPHTITISADGYDSITQTITVLPATTTLVISPTTLAADTVLANACNLDINSSGELKRISSWDETTNTKFNDYLANLSYTVTTIQFEGVFSIPSYSYSNGPFLRCTALQSGGTIENIKFAQGLTTIGCGIFYECTGLKTIDLSSASFTSTSTEIFYKCSSLVSIVLPNSLESIANDTFAECTSLTTIKLPSAMFPASGGAAYPVGTTAFNGCNKLSAIYIPDDAENFSGSPSYGSFSNCENGGTI